MLTRQIKKKQKCQIFYLFRCFFQNTSLERVEFTNVEAGAAVLWDHVHKRIEKM